MTMPTRGRLKCGRLFSWVVSLLSRALSGAQTRQISNNTPGEADNEVTIDFKATKEFISGTAEVEDHQRARLHVPNGYAYVLLAITRLLWWRASRFLVFSCRPLFALPSPQVHRDVACDGREQVRRRRRAASPRRRQV